MPSQKSLRRTRTLFPKRLASTFAVKSGAGRDVWTNLALLSWNASEIRTACERQLARIGNRKPADRALRRSLTRTIEACALYRELAGVPKHRWGILISQFEAVLAEIEPQRKAEILAAISAPSGVGPRLAA